MTHDVAIVGSGFTGSALAIQLLRQLPAGSRLLIVGRPKVLGRGVAYATECADHLLNVRAGRMSALHDDAGHFVRWVNQHEPHLCDVRDETADRYLPRSAYGRYVRATLLNEIALAQGRVETEIVEDPAADIRRLTNGYAIRTNGGRRFTASSVALCLGPGNSVFPFPSSTVALGARARLIAEPFSDYRVATIPRDARVLLVGTGLTAIDQVLALDSSGHVGPITAISRHGLLPAAHLTTRTEPVAPSLPPETTRLRPLARAVIRAARAVAAECGDWRAVVDGLRPATQRLWQGLDVAEQKRFTRHLGSFWAVHRHRMAPEIAARIDAHRRSGWLQVRKGRVVTIRDAAEGVVVAFQPRGSQTVEVLPFDWILNCSGSVASLANDPTLASIFADGTATRDGKAGLRINAACMVLNGAGDASSGLFALGPLTRGFFYEITAVPEIRVQAANVAKEMSARFTELHRAPRVLARRHVGDV